MLAAAEREVRGGVGPVEFDAARVREVLGIEVGALEQHQHQLPLADQHVADLDVGGGQAR